MISKLSTFFLIILKRVIAGCVIAALGLAAWAWWLCAHDEGDFSQRRARELASLAAERERAAASEAEAGRRVGALTVELDARQQEVAGAERAIELHRSVESGWSRWTGGREEQALNDRKREEQEKIRAEALERIAALKQELADVMMTWQRDEIALARLDRRIAAMEAVTSGRGFYARLVWDASNGGQGAFWFVAFWVVWPVARRFALYYFVAPFVIRRKPLRLSKNTRGGRGTDEADEAGGASGARGTALVGEARGVAMVGETRGTAMGGEVRGTAMVSEARRVVTGDEGEMAMVASEVAMGEMATGEVGKMVAGEVAMGEMGEVVTVGLRAGEVLCVKPGLVESADAGVLRRGRFWLKARFPIMNIACGLVRMAELRNEHAGAVGRVVLRGAAGHGVREREHEHKHEHERDEVCDAAGRGAAGRECGEMRGRDEMRRRGEVRKCDEVRERSDGREGCGRSDVSGCGVGLAVVQVAGGGSLVLRPRYLAGVAHAAGAPLVIRSHWRILSWHAWVTGQFRFFEFAGPCRLIVTGERGVRAETLGPRDDGRRPARRASVGATIGFTPGLRYRPARAKSFWSYCRGLSPLYDDLFIGEGMFFVQEAASEQGQEQGRGQERGRCGKGLARRFFAGAWRGFQRIFGM
ncbi:MAG: hypothetical protein LBM04_12105 [Opitutaceae bacterium]|nr:hypothetical protein [Opitutaceae bacterium]